jgi:hypothetical protein
MAKQDLDGVWTVLSSSIPTSGVAVAPTGHQVAAGSLLAGIDSDRRRHLLIPLLAGEAARTDTRGRAVHLARISHEGTQYLTIFCLRPELHRVFTQFCRELVASAESATSPAREAAIAFDRWRALLSDAASRDLLSEEALVGLLGELLTVESLLALGAPSGLEFWVGPFNEVHDIRTPSHAIEVKATLVREGRIVSISSVDQLQEPAGADLVLRHMRLERDPGGFDISAIVDRALDAGASASALATRMHEVGVNVDDLAPYGSRKYKLVETRTYDVTGPAFPRLVRSSFNAGDVPPGTLRIGYAIDLTNEPPFPLTIEAAEAALRTVAGEANSEVAP